MDHLSRLAAATTRRVADPAVTAMAPDVPDIEVVTASAVVMVWLPAVFSVAVNVPVPLVRTALPGKTAAVSLELKCTAPVYPVAVLFDASCAVTVKLN